MSGYRGTSPQMVEGDHEGDPSLSRRLAYLSVFLTVFGILVTIAWFGLGRFDPTATAYLSNHPGGLWALSLLLFVGLWAYLAGQEYGRRDEAVRTSTWRTARASRASSASRSDSAGDCRECSSVRAENAALLAEIKALKHGVATESDAVAPVSAEFVAAGPGCVEPASADLPVADLPVTDPVFEPMGAAPPAIGPPAIELSAIELPAIELPAIELPDRSDEVFDVLALPADQDLREAT